MQSSSTLAKKEQEKLLTPHEYIRDTLSFRYQDCISCGIRTEFTCIKCGYCYSCHWKKEQVEEIELRNNLKDFYVSLSNEGNDSTDNNIEEQKKWGTVDVFGKEVEPICTYYRCNHKFSLHGLGSHGCKCKRPTNKTLGVSLRVLLFLLFLYPIVLLS
ncbi:MAG: hypothetical protein WAM27_08775 [Nitrososphaeraceae archaeon]|jgi:hypothetical protein